MNLFQWIAVPVLGTLFLFEWWHIITGHPRFRIDRVVRGLVWGGATLAIFNPNLTSLAAAAVGIERGADLVMYVFVLTFLGVSFYFYSRNVRLERKLTELVRHAAIRDARNRPVGLSEAQGGHE